MDSRPANLEKTQRLLPCIRRAEIAALSPLLERIGPCVGLACVLRMSAGMKAMTELEDVAREMILQAHRDWALCSGATAGELSRRVTRIAGIRTGTSSAAPRPRSPPSSAGRRLADPVRALHPACRGLGDLDQPLAIGLALPLDAQDDVATSGLMKRMHAARKPGPSVAVALRTAQRRIRMERTHDGSHPRYGAPWVSWALPE